MKVIQCWDELPASNGREHMENILREELYATRKRERH